MEKSSLQWSQSKVRRWLAVALAGVLVGFAWAPTAAAENVLQVVSVRVEPGRLDDYAAQITKLNAIMDRLGVDATVRMWRATAAGDATGMVAVGVEYPSLVAYAEGTTKTTADAEWQKLVADLGGMRTIVATSLYREVTP